MFGIPIQGNGLRTLANNHNFIGAKYAPAFAYYHAGAGISTGATTGSTWKNVTGTTIPPQADGRGITVRLQAENTNSTSIGKLRIKTGTQTSDEILLPANTAYATYTRTLATTNTAEQVCVIQAQQDSHTDVKVRAASWFWTPYSGSVTGNPTSSGYVYAVPGDFSDTEPLTVEQYNRLRGAPRVMFEAMPQTACSMVQSWYTPDNTNKTSRSLMAYLPIVKRRNNLRLRFDVIAEAQAVEIFVPGLEDQAGTYYSVSPSISSGTNMQTTDPGSLSANSSVEIDFTNHPIFTQCAVFATSPDSLTQSRVYSVQAVIV